MITNQGVGKDVLALHDEIKTLFHKNGVTPGPKKKKKNVQVSGVLYKLL